MEALAEAISTRKEKLNAQIVEKTLGKDDSLALINRESLLDSLQALYDECNIESLQKNDKYISQFVEKFKSTILKVKRLRVNMTDFEIKNVIGRGHFGEVHVVREKQTGDVYALKSIRKSDSLTSTSFGVERDIMAFSDSPWLTSLRYAFQDSSYLFFVMEFHPGGDLLSLLYRQGGTLPESAAIFYLAELVLALEDLHGMGYVHRDVKPDNVLLDRCGHLKLVDFGSAARLNGQGFVSEGPPVGTPDYVAPEVLLSVEGKGSKNYSYGVSCDYWSLGVLAYELTVGRTPFSSQNTSATYARIMNHSNSLKFPPDLLLTQSFTSLLKSLITDSRSRLNAKQIKSHSLFKKTNFDSLRCQVPPFVPKITAEDDTSNFSDVPAKDSTPNVENFKKKTSFSGRNLPFIGFSYTGGVSSGSVLCRDSFAKDETIKNLRNKLKEVRVDLEKSEDWQGSKIGLEKKISEQTLKMEGLENLRNKLEKDLAAALAENGALRRTLEVERKDRAELEIKALDLIKSAKVKWEASERSKIESLKLEIEHQRDKIVQLSTTNELLEQQLQRAFGMEDKHRRSLETVENLSRRSVIGLESRLEKITTENKATISELQASLNEANLQKQLLAAEVEKRQSREANLREKLQLSQENYENLAGKVTEAEKTIRELVRKVTELENEVQLSDSLKTELLGVREELDSCTLKTKTLELERKRLEEENASIKRYENEIKDAKEARRKLEGRIHELEQNLREERENVANLKNHALNSSENEEMKEMRMKLWKAEKELGNCKIDKRILERELKDAQRQVKELEGRVEELEGKVSGGKRANDKAMMELSGINEVLTMELVKVKEACRSLEARLGEEKERGEGEKVLLTELKEVIHGKDLEIAGVKRQINAVKEENANLTNRNNVVEKEKDALISDLNNLRKERDGVVNRLENAKRQMENTQLNWEALREACTLLESQVVEYERINASMQNEKRSLTENTEKLIADLCDAKSEIQEAKKRYNEEKSLRLLTETKVKRLHEDLDCLQNENSSYKNQCLEFRECSNNLSTELSLAEEKISELELGVKSCERKIHDMFLENNNLKEEISRYLTQISSARDANFELKQQIEELKFTNDVFMQRNDELERTLNAKVNYYEEREMKNSATIKQQTKLIDYLQVKIDEQNQKKKTFTLFGHSRKENQPPTMLPGNLRDLEGQLQKQRGVNRELLEQVQKLKLELACKTPVLKKTEGGDSCRKKIEGCRPFEAKLGKSLCSTSSVRVGGEGSPSIVEGWIKILSKTKTWEKRYACLTPTCLNIYTSPASQNGNLLESLDLTVPLKRKKITLETVLPGTDTNEISPTFKIEISPESTCWPPVTKAFMASCETERDMWFKALQKVFNEDVKYNIDCVIDFKQDFYLNHVMEVTKNILILGTDRGLYTHHNDSLLFIEGLSQVLYFAMITSIKCVVMIANENQGLVTCDLNHLLNLSQCAAFTNPTLTYKRILVDMDGFHFLETTSKNDEIFCAATAKQLVIIKSDLDGGFVPLRVMDTAEPISCALFTDSTLIVGADKFFEIELRHFKADEFIDSSDLRLRHVAKCHKRKSFPLSILHVQDVPTIYLLCFNESAIFVDENGRSVKESEIRPISVPFGFYLVRPYLYVVHFSGVQILRLSEEVVRSEDEVNGCMIDLHGVRYLGLGKRGIYVLHDGKIKLLEGSKLSEDSCSIVSQSFDDESDKFSFTSSIVQSLDGNLSDVESCGSVDNFQGRRVKFSQTNL